MTTTPHDALFKAVFSAPPRAAELLRSLLPPALVEAIAWGTLALLPGSFVDAELRSLHTDLLFAARMRGRDIRLLVVLEHQSGPTRWLGLRMLRYMTSAWFAEVDRDKDLQALPPILPVVIHHCDRAWSVDPEFSTLVECDDLAALLALTPKFRLLLADLGTIDSEDLRSGPGATAVRAALLALKETRNAATVEQLFRGLAVLLNRLEWEPGGADVIELVIRYILTVRGAEGFLGLDIRRLGLGKTSEAIMETMEQYLLRKGREEGREEGREAGREEGREAAQEENLRRNRSVLVEMLRAKFTHVPAAVSARVEAADVDSLTHWFVRLVVASSLDEVFEPAH